MSSIPQPDASTQRADGVARGPAPAQRVAAFLLSFLAAGLLAFLLSVTYGLTSEYGFTAPRLQPVDGLIVLVLGGLALLLLVDARARLGARRPTTPMLAAVVLTVFGGGAAVSAALGGAAHDRRTATVALACSAQDRAVLGAVDVPGVRLGPLGQPDGGCVLHLSPPTDAAAAARGVTANLVREGWRTVERARDTVVLERDGALLTVAVVSDDKTGELVLTLS